ncbi:MAG TPA: hypothetical protein VHC44_07525 [Verrucomicrobiae bacterium]|nr:hypothetical protein [Verrucomicrobiae bacterium]
MTNEPALSGQAGVIFENFFARWLWAFQCQQIFKESIESFAGNKTHD